MQAALFAHHEPQLRRLLQVPDPDAAPGPDSDVFQPEGTSASCSSTVFNDGSCALEQPGCPGAYADWVKCRVLTAVELDGECPAGCTVLEVAGVVETLCIPTATVADAPALTAADVSDYNACVNTPDTPGCTAALETFRAGTGCLDECVASSQEYVQLSNEFCSGVAAADCDTTAVPCGTAPNTGTTTPLEDALADAETTSTSRSVTGGCEFSGGLCFASSGDCANEAAAEAWVTCAGGPPPCSSGCEAIGMTDATGDQLCVPLGTAGNVPPMATSDVQNYFDCSGNEDGECRVAAQTFNRGTGCLDDCEHAMFAYFERMFKHCFDATTAAECATISAPCTDAS